MEDKQPIDNGTTKWHEELEILHAIIAKTQLTETKKWGVPVFTHNGKNVVGIVGFKNHFTLWFYQGVFLNDPAQVLINANEEATKALRQWRFSAMNEINETLILAYINEAIENVNLGLQLKPSPKKKVVDALLQEVLEKDKQLEEHFLQFTPAKQNEFMEFIAAAKRDATKWTRIEKIRPLILSNKGLNDAYKK
ncbi:YdeI/OmpD-associated family protein [Flavobacterium sp. SM2513]|uniref:YdeI/OmpD-associated family protein n=1 Tax=Flavobacterium sp. SM2513 TaxID=3424766 RepID=UPI003D7FCCAC